MKLIYDKKHKIVINLDQVYVAYISKIKYATDRKTTTSYRIESTNGNTFEVSKKTYEKIKELVE